MVHLQSKVLKHHINIKAFTDHWERSQAKRNYDMIRMGLKATGAESKESWGWGVMKHFQSKSSSYVPETPCDG